jgi:hypothetical protein
VYGDSARGLAKRQNSGELPAAPAAATTATKGQSLLLMFRVGQNHIYMPYMTVFVEIPANSTGYTPGWFWPTLVMFRVLESNQGHTKDI